MSDKNFWKHQKSSEFVSINSSLQFMHSYIFFAETPRYLEIPLIDFCETSQSRRQAPKA